MARHTSDRMSSAAGAGDASCPWPGRAGAQRNRAEDGNGASPAPHTGSRCHGGQRGGNSREAEHCAVPERKETRRIPQGRAVDAGTGRGAQAWGPRQHLCSGVLTGEARIPAGGHRNIMGGSGALFGGRRQSLRDGGGQGMRGKSRVGLGWWELLVQGQGYGKEGESGRKDA